MGPFFLIAGMRRSLQHVVSRHEETLDSKRLTWKRLPTQAVLT
jgi:hypothetical protein